MARRMALSPAQIALVALGVLAVIAIGASLRDARRFRRRVLESLRWGWTSYRPRVLLIVPCRGADPQLEGNAVAILTQAGLAYRTVFVVDDLDDPAVRGVRAAIGSSPSATAAILAAPLRLGYSGKASALLGGLE